MRILMLLPLFLILTWTYPSAFAKQNPTTAANIFAPSASGQTPSEDSKQIVQTFYSIMQDGDTKDLNAILAPDYHMINAGDIQDSSYSRFTEMSKNLKVRIMALHKALPDFKLDVSEILADGNKVLARVTISGIQKGPFLGIAPTNKPIHIKFFDIFTIKDGKIIYIAEMWNELSVMKQLGYIIL